MDDLTAEIAKARALCDAATPGPWEHLRPYGRSEILGPPWPDQAKKRHPLRRPVVTIESSGACSDPDCCPQDEYIDVRANDAAFIAASRTLVPRLIAALKLAIAQRNARPVYDESDTHSRSAHKKWADEDDAAILAALRGGE